MIFLEGLASNHASDRSLLCCFPRSVAKLRVSIPRCHEHTPSSYILLPRRLLGNSVMMLSLYSYSRYCTTRLALFPSQTFHVSIDKVHTEEMQYQAPQHEIRKRPIHVRKSSANKIPSDIPHAIPLSTITIPSHSSSTHPTQAALHQSNGRKNEE